MIWPLGIELVCVIACASKMTTTLKRTNEEIIITALESRNDEQAATYRNQVFDQSDVEIWLAQGLYEPSANLIAGETTGDSSDQSQPSTSVRRMSAAKRNTCAREAAGDDARDESRRRSAVRSIRQLIKHDFCDGQQAQNYHCRKRADERQWPREFEPTEMHGPRDGRRRRKRAQPGAESN